MIAIAAAALSFGGLFGGMILQKPEPFLLAALALAGLLAYGGIS